VSGPGENEPVIVARGWATVDLERAAGELAATLAASSTFEVAAASTLLGARCVRGTAADGRGLIVLLEPDREGRIAAFLARHGEGWAATWLAEPVSPEEAARGAALPGPLGTERLEPGPVRGPFRLLVRPATIGR
jgi:hypothetical protein